MRANKQTSPILLAAVALSTLCWRGRAATFHIHGTVIDCATAQPLTNVAVDFVYAELARPVDQPPTMATTNTDANGEFDFEGPSGEFSSQLQVSSLPAGYVAPLRETVRLDAPSPTAAVTFRAGAATTVTGSVVVAGGTTDYTKFYIEVNASEVQPLANGTFVLPAVPFCQQTARVTYEDGSYFDERVIPLPAMTPGHTNSIQIFWHPPMQNLSASGVLRDVNGNVLDGARIRFLGMTTGVFVGMKTDANGNYAIYDLPADCYAVRAFVGRWGIEQRTLSAADSILCVGNGGGDSVGDGVPDGWRLQYFGNGTTTNTSSCASCDPDGDGVSNLQEYLRGTNPEDATSSNITLYANSLIGSNGFDGIKPTVVGGHGPKLNIQAAISAAISGDSVEIASGQYVETTFDPQSKTVTLKPVGTITIP